MYIKYVGNRPVVSIMCSGRKNYIFHKDNDFTQEIESSQHASQILRSVQHKFETYLDDPKAEKKFKKEYIPEPSLTHPAIADTPHTPVELPKKPKTKAVKEIRTSGGKK